MEAPKVFISHAWEDKERFVEPFARGLRTRKIDAWLDKWEMKPGDSLVEKIFDEGIRNADAFIIVLSNISVSKKWVREELNAAVVKKIEQGRKLIPVRLDDCDVPNALSSTIWQTVSNTDCPDAVAARIAAVIHGVESRPSLGEAPRYLRSVIDHFPGLNQIDSVILTLACEQRLSESKQNQIFRASSLLSKAIEEGIAEEMFWDSVEILNHQGYFRGNTFVRSRDGSFVLSEHAFDDYLKSTYPNFQEIEETIARSLINDKAISFQSLSSRFDLSIPILDHILSKFKNRGYIDGVRFESGNWRITKICASLKRSFV